MSVRAKLGKPRKRMKMKRKKVKPNQRRNRKTKRTKRLGPALSVKVRPLNLVKLVTSQIIVEKSAKKKTGNGFINFSAKACPSSKS